MADRLPLLRGTITRTDTYEAPQGGGGSSISLPALDARAHGTRLLGQIDALRKQLSSRVPEFQDEFATREIVAVHPLPGASLAPDQLDDSKSARLVGIHPDTGAVILDVKDGNLDYLRKKVESFSDDSRVRRKMAPDGSVTLHRRSERAIAPVDRVGMAAVPDLGGRALDAILPAPGIAHWFEIGCRGGYRRPPEESRSSRAQIHRKMDQLHPRQKVDEFEAAEQIYFFVRLTLAELESLRAAVNCIYEVGLAPASLRDLRLLDDTRTRDLSTFDLKPPSPEAPAIVILDTGIATGHPLLKAAILSATTAGEWIPSPEDTHGHGTRMAGVALYSDLGRDIERGGAQAAHWLQSSRLLVAPGFGTADDENHENWPTLTLGAVRSAEEADRAERNRVFVMAMGRSLQVPPLEGEAPTLWSHAMDQIAYNEGRGRLLIVSAGNARHEQWLALAEQYPQLQLSEKIHQPGQASNVLTIGAFTEKDTLPPLKDYAEAKVIAPRGGISPFTSTGLVGNEWPIKPDLMMEGGNLAVAGPLPDEAVPTLCTLTTSRRQTIDAPLAPFSMTSEAAARAARLAARV